MESLINLQCFNLEKEKAELTKQILNNFSCKDCFFSKQDFIKTLLLGTLCQSDIFEGVKKFGLSNLKCFVLLISVDKGDISEITDIITYYGSDDNDIVLCINDKVCAFIKFIDEVSDDYRSAKDFSGFLATSVFEETGINVCISIGNTCLVEKVSLSFNQALSAHLLSKNTNIKGKIHTYKDFIFSNIVNSLPQEQLKDYLQTLIDFDSAIFDNAENVDIAEEFLANNLNISETARKLYLHRNTLINKLDKIEKETGLNLRNFEDAVTFRLITNIKKVVKNDE